MTIDSFLSSCLNFFFTDIDVVVDIFVVADKIVMIIVVMVVVVVVVMDIDKLVAIHGYCDKFDYNKSCLGIKIVTIHVRVCNYSCMTSNNS